MDRDPNAERAKSAGLVVLADDDVLLCELQQRWLKDEGFEVKVHHDGESSLAGLTEALPDTVCLDLVMPGLDGIETLKRIKAHHPLLPVIVMTAHGGVESAVEAMKCGAYDYLVKPVERTKFIAEVRNAVHASRMSLRVAQLEREASGRGYPGILGESRSMKDLFRRLDRLATSDITVMIQGESGTGKELVARAIHDNSARSKEQFIALSCAAIPESLQESELFGHEKGAFTGATSRRAGCFERADGGTLFLDEIGELTSSLQAKLLRVLQERTFQRVGGSGEIRSDFRLIVATHRDLTADVRAGRFREDLFFRVAVMDLFVPPLRERREDVPLLARHFIDRAWRRKSQKAPQLAPDTLEVLVGHTWPGNVRELQNAIERAVVECDGKVIRVRDLPSRVRNGELSDRSGAGVPGGLTAGPASQEERLASTELGATTAGEIQHEPVRTLEQMERDAIAASLERNRGNMSEVVRELGIGRTTLYRKIKKYGLK